MLVFQVIPLFRANYCKNPVSAISGHRPGYGTVSVASRRASLSCDNVLFAMIVNILSSCYSRNANYGDDQYPAQDEEQTACADEVL